MPKADKPKNNIFAIGGGGYWVVGGKEYSSIKFQNI